MQPTTPDIEQIIRVVLQRLAAADDLAAGIGQIVGKADESELSIDDRVVTTSTLEKKLDGKRRVRVHPRAVVTPAVRDLLRGLKIELVRDESAVSKPMAARATGMQVKGSVGSAKAAVGGSIAATQDRLAPVLVCGSALWFNSLTRHLCSKQATVQACEDAVATSLVSQHLSRGGRRAVWLSSQAFSASVAASRAGCCSAVQLPSLRELSEALTQANPQLLIVDSSRWTVAAIGNLVRALMKHPAPAGKS